MIPFSTAKIDIISYSPKFFKRNFAKQKNWGNKQGVLWALLSYIGFDMIIEYSFVVS